MNFEIPFWEVMICLCSFGESSSVGPTGGFWTSYREARKNSSKYNEQRKQSKMNPIHQDSQRWLHGCLGD